MGTGLRPALREHLFVMRMDGAFLAGFVAGEGHFSIRPNNAGQSWSCGFQLVQRDDNVELVQEARDLVDAGETTWVPPHGTSHAQAMWLVRTMEGCSRLASSLRALRLLESASMSRSSPGAGGRSG